MKRIILHWSGGTHRASALDRQHYHLVIQGDGSVVYGDKPISANAAPLGKNYAAHTRGLNTDSIGIAVCAMAGAMQSPFHAGQYPVTEAQVQRLVKECARLADGYGIPVTRQTILSHAEVEPTLGVKQAGKWDIAWIPGRTRANDPIGVGDHLRQMIRGEMQGRPAPKPPATTAPAAPTPAPTPAQPVNPLAALFAWLSKLFGGN